MKTTPLLIASILGLCSCERSLDSPPPPHGGEGLPGRLTQPAIAATLYDYKAASLVTHRGLSAWIQDIRRDEQTIRIDYCLRMSDSCDLVMKSVTWCGIDYIDDKGQPVGDGHAEEISLKLDALYRREEVHHVIEKRPPPEARAVRVSLGTGALYTRPCLLPPPVRLLH